MANENPGDQKRSSKLVRIPDVDRRRDFEVIERTKKDDASEEEVTVALDNGQEAIVRVPVTVEKSAKSLSLAQIIVMNERGSLLELLRSGLDRNIRILGA